MTEEEIRAVVTTARDYGFKVAAHAHGAEGIKRAVRAGVDTIEHGTFMDEEGMKLMKEHGTFYVPTISAGRWVFDQAQDPTSFRDVLPDRVATSRPWHDVVERQARRAVAAVGTAPAVPGEEHHREMRRLTDRGTRTYETSRITWGRTYVFVAVRSGSSRRSTTSAFPFHTSTWAQRVEHTLSGS